MLCLIFNKTGEVLSQILRQGSSFQHLLKLGGKRVAIWIEVGWAQLRHEMCSISQDSTG
jgi:hypothetical protein